MPAKSSLAGKRPKIIAVVGQTATGKSDLAVAIAKKIHGEVVSCDSRQIYRGLDLGTGKVPGVWQSKRYRGHMVRAFFYKGIPHHCIDFVSPRQQFSAAEFVTVAKKAIAGIVSRGNVPVLCGGTGHWVDALVLGQILPEVPPNPELRARLEKKSADTLFARLQKKDPVRAASIDAKNPHRLIRALEIIAATGKPVPARANTEPPYDCLWIGLKKPQHVLTERIAKRLKQRLRAGMVLEAKQLRKKGVSFERLDELGLEYRFLARYLQGQLTTQELTEQLTTAIVQYAKRQLTWFKRNSAIVWVSSDAAAHSRVTKFLKIPNS